MTKTWTSVYTDKEGNEMLLTNLNYWGETEQEARDIRLGTKLVECIILGLTVGEPRQFDTTNLPHIPGHLPNTGGHFPVPVAVIGGPQFDAAVAKVTP